MEVGGQLHALAALLPRERTLRTYWIGGWMGPRFGLEAVAKRKNLLLLLLGIECLTEFHAMKTR
jgi:hypothetical protein